MFTFIICVRLFSGGKNDLSKIFFLIIVIFLDIQYIKKHARIRIKYSHKILNQLKERKVIKAEKNSHVKFLENSLRKKTF